MISFSEWMAGFRDLHEKACAGRLDAVTLQTYFASRDELMRSLLVAQQITREFGHAARQSVRIAWALQVDLGSKLRTRAVTLDLSAGGFSALLGAPPAPEDEIEVTIRLPRSAPLCAKARAVAVLPRPGAYRVSFAFVSLAADEQQRLESLLFDQVLTVMSARPGDARAA